MKFDRTDLVKFRDFEIELMFFDDMGPEPVTFIVRRNAPEGMEKYGKFLVNADEPGPGGEILKTTRIWKQGYFNTMSLEEFLVKTLGA